MRARVKVAFGWYTVGMVFEPNGLLFDLLKSKGWVEAVPPDTPICLDARAVHPAPIMAQADLPLAVEAPAPVKKPRKRNIDR